MWNWCRLAHRNQVLKKVNLHQFSTILLSGHPGGGPTSSGSTAEHFVTPDSSCVTSDTPASEPICSSDRPRQGLQCATLNVQIGHHGQKLWPFVCLPGMFSTCDGMFPTHMRSMVCFLRVVSIVHAASLFYSAILRSYLLRTKSCVALHIVSRR